MISLKTMSLKAKLTSLIMTVAFFALILGFAVITALDTVYFRKELLDDYVLNAKMTAEYCVGDLVFGYKDEAVKTLEKLSLMKSIEYAGIYDTKGRLFAGYARENKTIINKSAKTIPPLRKSLAKFINGSLEIYEPMTYKGEYYGMLHTHVSTNQLTEKIWDRVNLILLLAFCIAIIVFFLAASVQRLISRPILKLAEMTRNIAKQQDYSIRSSMKRGDEIGTLAEGFNAMLIDLENRRRERDAATAELVKAHNELEDKVTTRTAELRMANKELEAFTYSASHDLRGPLRRIDGFTSLLDQEYKSVLDSTGKEYIQKARNSCRHMTEIIDNLLKLSRVVRQEMECKTVDMTALAKEAIKRLQDNDPKRKINIVIAEGIKAKGDPGLLMESIENMLENAWKFTNKTENPAIEFGMITKENQSVYFVKDNGCGFEMKYLHKIFKPFQRLHTLSEFPGTGIGLSTVQRVIERHKGRIWAEGELNKGATVSFTLWTECKKMPRTF